MPLGAFATVPSSSQPGPLPGLLHQPIRIHIHTSAYINTYTISERQGVRVYIRVYIYVCIYTASEWWGGGVCVRAAPCFGKLGEMGFWAKTLQIWGGAKGRGLGGGGDTHLPPHNRGRGSGREWGKNERHLNIGFFPGLVCWGFFFWFWFIFLIFFFFPRSGEREPLCSVGQCKQGGITLGNRKTSFLSSRRRLPFLQNPPNNNKKKTKKTKK